MDFLLSTSQLKKLLHIYSSTKYLKSVDVCAINELPHAQTLIHRPAGFIVNSDPNFKPGRHWMVIFLPGSEAGKPSKQTEFFDPCGLPPSTYGKQLVKFLEDNSELPYVFNSLPVQPEWSTLCGLYSCYYILKRLNGKSGPDIIKYLFWIDEGMLLRHFEQGLYCLSE